MKDLLRYFTREPKKKSASAASSHNSGRNQGLEDFLWPMPSKPAGLLPYNLISIVLHDFLKDEKIRDLQRRRSSDQDYDPTTLYIPPNAKITPSMEIQISQKMNEICTMVSLLVNKPYK